MNQTTLLERIPAGEKIQERKIREQKEIALKSETLKTFEYKNSLDFDIQHKILSAYSAVQSYILQNKTGKENLKNAGLQIQDVEKELKNCEENLERENERNFIIKFFKKSEVGKINENSKKLLKKTAILRDNLRKLEKEEARHKEELKEKIKETTESVRNSYFKLQDEIFNNDELKAGLDKNKAAREKLFGEKIGAEKKFEEMEKIPLIELMANNESSEKILLLQKIMEDSDIDDTLLKNGIKIEINKIIAPREKGHFGEERPVVESIYSFRENPNKVSLDIDSLPHDVMWKHYLENAEDWEIIKNNGNIKKIFGETPIKNFECKISNYLLRHLMDSSPHTIGSMDSGEKLLHFKSPSSIPYSIINFWREPGRSGEMYFLNIHHQPKETKAYKFINSFSKEELKELKEKNIPGLMNVINLVLENPDSFRDREIKDENGKYVKNSVADEIQENLEKTALYFLRNEKSDNAIKKFALTYLFGHPQKKLELNKDEYNLTLDFYLGNNLGYSANRNIEDFLFTKSAKFENGLAAEAVKKIYSGHIASLRLKEALYFKDDFKMFASPQKNQTISDVINFMEIELKSFLSPENIVNLSFGDLDLILEKIDGELNYIFKENYEKYKTKIISRACLSFAYEGDIAHSLLEKIKEKEWITIQTYNRLYAARRALSGFESYAYLPKSGEDHPVINVTRFGRIFGEEKNKVQLEDYSLKDANEFLIGAIRQKPSERKIDIKLYPKNYELYKEKIRELENLNEEEREKLLTNFTWYKKRRKYPEDQLYEKIDNLTLPIGIAENGHSHFYATPYGIVSGCIATNPESSGIFEKKLGHFTSLGINMVTGHKEMLSDFIEKEERTKEEIEGLTEKTKSRDIPNAVSFNFENLDLPEELKEMVLPPNITVSEALLNLHLEQYLHKGIKENKDLLKNILERFENGEIEVLLKDKKLSLTSQIPPDSRVIIKKIK